MKQILNVLLIDHNYADAHDLRRMLNEAPGVDLTFTHVTNLADARVALAEDDPDVILTSVILPDSNGLQTITHLVEIASAVPIIALTKQRDNGLSLDAMRSGAQDYLIKEEVDSQLLLRSVRYAIERKHAQEELRQSEEKYRSLLDLMSDALFLVDDKTGVLHEANGAATKLYGYTREEFLEMKNTDLSAEPESTRRNTLNREVTKVPLRYHRKKDGTTFPVEITATRIMWNGHPCHIPAIRDISFRMQSEQKLKQLSTAVEQSSAIIVITDTTGSIEYVNKKFTEVTGYTKEEVIGQNPRILKSGDKSAADYSGLWQTISSGREWRGEFLNKKKNGDSYSESALISPIVDDENRITHFLAVKEDITERKELEEKLRQAQKMESIGTLAGGIAHDFNNILGIILGHAGLLADGSVTEESLQKGLNAIDVASRRGAALVRQILTFARQTETQLGPVRVNDIVYELSKMLSETFPKSITFSLDIGQQLPMIEGSATQIHQTLLNLCVNARDAMPYGGAITMSTRYVDGARVRETFPAASGSGYVQVIVKDTGEGMSGDVQKRIFEPFFTTKELNKGTGLGLSVVYGIVTEHRGFIHVESLPERGTEFFVYFPAPEEHTAPKPDASPRQSSAVGKNELILVVDDEDLLRDAVKDTLIMNNYRVLTAKDGADAVQVFSQHREAIELVLMDFGMPRLTGLGALREMKKMSPDMKCIIASGYFDLNAHDEICNLHSALLLSKPYLQAEILALVRQVLDGVEDFDR